jgi:hypothetical protein
MKETLMPRPHVFSWKWVIVFSGALGATAFVGLPWVLHTSVSSSSALYYSYQCPFIANGRDFNGDSIDAGVTWNPPTGLWRAPQDGGNTSWGQYGDIPAPGDYNADGQSDFAVFRPSTGQWFVKCSTATNCAGGAKVVSWGAAGDIPVPADYNDDGFTDYGIWRAPTALWYVLSGADAATAIVNGVQWGRYGDCPIPARLQGGGAGPLELNVWRPEDGIWYYGRSLAGVGGSALGWGVYGDLPFALDTDNDGDDDILVYRPSTGIWYGQAPSFAVQWGLPGDIPTVSDGHFLNNTVPVLNAWRPTTRQFFLCGGNAVGGFSGLSSCASSGVWSPGTTGLTGDIPISGSPHN